jgi:hypothetical protein
VSSAKDNLTTLVEKLMDRMEKLETSYSATREPVPPVCRGRAAEAGARGAGRDLTSPAGNVEDQGILLDIVLSHRETFRMRSPVQRDTDVGAQSSKLRISLVTPAGGYHVKGELHGHTMALVDTEASVTLMRKDVWDQVNQAHGVRLEPWTEQQLTDLH